MAIDTHRYVCNNGSQRYNSNSLRLMKLSAASSGSKKTMCTMTSLKSMPHRNRLPTMPAKGCYSALVTNLLQTPRLENAITIESIKSPASPSSYSSLSACLPACQPACLGLLAPGCSPRAKQWRSLSIAISRDILQHIHSAPMQFLYNSQQLWTKSLAASSYLIRLIQYNYQNLNELT